MRWDDGVASLRCAAVRASLRSPRRSLARGDAVNKMPQPSRVMFAAAMIALGITGVVNGDFALVWQHVPAGISARTILAYLCAAIEIALGLGLLFERTLRP